MPRWPPRTRGRGLGLVVLFLLAASFVGVDAGRSSLALFSNAAATKSEAHRLRQQYMSGPKVLDVKDLPGRIKSIETHVERVAAGVAHGAQQMHTQRIPRGGSGQIHYVRTDPGVPRIKSIEQRHVQGPLKSIEWVQPPPVHLQGKEAERAVALMHAQQREAEAEAHRHHHGN